MEKWAYRAGRNIMESADDLNKKLKGLKGHTRETPVFNPVFQKGVVPDAGAAESAPTKNPVTMPNRAVPIKLDKNRDERGISPTTSARNISPRTGLKQKDERRVPDRIDNKPTAAAQQAFTPDEQMVNFFLSNLERKNTDVRNIGGNQVVSSGVMVPGLSTQEQYGYTPDQRDVYADKIRQGMIQNNQARQVYRENNAENPNIIEYLMGTQPMYANPNDPMQRYGTRGEAERMEPLPVTEAAKDRQMETDKAMIGTLGRGQQGPTPYAAAKDEMGFVQKAVSGLGEFATPEEIASTEKAASLKYKYNTHQLIRGTSPNGETIFRTLDGSAIYDSQGNDISSEFQGGPGPQASSSTPTVDPIAQMYEQQYAARNQAQAGQKLVNTNRQKLDSWFSDYGGRDDWHKNRSIG